MRARAVPQDCSGRGAADVAADHHGVKLPPHADPTEGCAQVHPHVPGLGGSVSTSGQSIVYLAGGSLVQTFCF
jgi:hypothetical protein